MEKGKKITDAILKPSKKTLFYCALALFVLVGIFLCVLFLAKDEVRPTFAYSWTAFFVLFVLYMLYGYVRILLVALLEKKKEEKLAVAFVKDKPFRSLFARFGGVVAGFAFVGWNLYKALIGDHMMHWILAEFYWFVSIIRLYMDYIYDREEGAKKDVAYTIINVCLVFLSGVIVAITAFVLYFDAIFAKSWLTVFPIAAFTVYKVVSGVVALIKAQKTHKIYDWTFASAAFSCALFSTYTLIIAMMIMYGSDKYIEFANAGFAVAAVVFIFGILGISFSSRRIDVRRKITEKELSDMTKEELWQLFPIFLVPPKKEWAEQYEEMEKRLSSALSDCQIDRISHIGSTAVPGIWAKDIVDVLVEISPDGDLEDAAKILDKMDFNRMFTEENRISFNNGYTKNGFADKVYHVHLRYTGDNDELYFRDYLIEHPDVAKEYEERKLRLWKEYEHDRDGYTENKTDFIKRYTLLAKKEYGARYDGREL